MKRLVRLVIRTIVLLIIVLLPFILVGVVMEYKVLQIILGMLAVLLTIKEIKEAK